MPLVDHNPRARWDTLQEDYQADDLSYLRYYTVGDSGLPHATQDTVRQAGFETLSDICDMPIQMIGTHLQLGAVEGAELVSWVNDKKGFFANQLDILGVMQIREHLKQGNRLAAQDAGYRDWMDAHDQFVTQTDVIPTSQSALLEMLENSVAGSVERKLAATALRQNVGRVESVTALDTNFKYD